MQEKIFRAIFIALFAMAGIILSVRSEGILIELLPHSVIAESFLGVTLLSVVMILVGALLGGAVGFMLSPHLIRWLLSLISGLESALSDFSAWDLLLGTLGLFLGLVVANLIGVAFDQVPVVGPYVSVVLSIVLGYLGMHLCLEKKSEFQAFVQAHQEGIKKKDKKEKDAPRGKLLDTNIIIDGRIVDVYKSGFLEGPIIVPVFVLLCVGRITKNRGLLRFHQKKSRAARAGYFESAPPCGQGCDSDCGGGLRRYGRSRFQAGADGH